MPKLKSVTINGRKFDITPDMSPIVMTDHSEGKPLDFFLDAMAEGRLLKHGDRVRILHHDVLAAHGITAGLMATIRSPIWSENRVIYKVTIDDMDASFWFDFSEDTIESWKGIVEVVNE